MSETILATIMLVVFGAIILAKFIFASYVA